MKKFVSWLLCAAMTATLCAGMSGGASAAGTDVDPNWQYKEMVNFDELSAGLKFGSKDDKYSQYCERGTGWQAKVGTGGYKGSSDFCICSKSTKQGDYAQPLVNATGFEQKNTEFKGASEFWMWVDFSHVEWDDALLQMRLIEQDYNKDGTPVSGTDNLSQFAVGKDKPIYIQSSPTAWKQLNVSTEYKIPVDKMQGYKGFIRIPLSSLVVHKSSASDADNGKINLENMYQVWFVFNFPNKNPQTDYIAFDQLMFVGKIQADGKAISKIKLTDTNQGTNDTTKAPSTTAAPTTLAATTAAETTAVLTTAAATTAATTAATETKSVVNPKPDKGFPVAAIVIIAVCVVLIGGGAAVYFFVIRKKKKPTDLSAK